MSFVVPVKENQQQSQRMEYQLPTVATPAPLVAHQVPVGVMQGTLTHPQQQHPTQEDQQRWTQYQQLWRQHVYMNGMIPGGGKLGN